MKASYKQLKDGTWGTNPPATSGALSSPNHIEAWVKWNNIRHAIDTVNAQKYETALQQSSMVLGYGAEEAKKFYGAGGTAWTGSKEPKQSFLSNLWDFIRGLGQI